MKDTRPADIFGWTHPLRCLLSQGKRLTALHVFHHATVVVMAYLWLAAGQVGTFSTWPMWVPRVFELES